LDVSLGGRAPAGLGERAHVVRLHVEARDPERVLAREVNEVPVHEHPVERRVEGDEHRAAAVRHPRDPVGEVTHRLRRVGAVRDKERMIARAMRERPSAKVTVATKGGLERPGGAWVTNGTPQHLRAACERSLKALGVETIDLYQLHAPDSKVTFADSIGALA